MTGNVRDCDEIFDTVEIGWELWMDEIRQKIRNIFQELKKVQLKAWRLEELGRIENSNVYCTKQNKKKADFKNLFQRFFSF